MNIFLIVVLIILAASMIWGYWRGFVRITFSLVAMILMIVLVSWATPYITDFLKANTTIYENLVERCAQEIQDTAEEGMANTIEDTAGDLASETKKVSDNIQLPQLWVEQIMEKVGVTVSQNMENSGVYRQIGEYIADWILRGISFFAAFLLTAIFLKLIVGLLDIIAKLPLIKGVNRLLGGVAGLVQGIVIVWLLLFFVTIACTTQFGMSIQQYINESKILTYLYQHNGIIYFINYVFG